MPPHNNRPRQLINQLIASACPGLDVDVAELDESFNVIDAGLFDSLGFLELLAQLESHLAGELNLYDVDPERLTTVGGLVALAAAAPAPTSSRSLSNE